jgi:hypothetical protein
MLFIEFPIDLDCGNNIIKYRDVSDESWYYIYMDLETLNLLIQNYGIISTYKIPTRFTNADNPTTSTIVKIKYCGAAIELYCHDNTSPHLALKYIEQNY